MRSASPLFVRNLWIIGGYKLQNWGLCFYYKDQFHWLIHIYYCKYVVIHTYLSHYILSVSFGSLLSAIIQLLPQIIVHKNMCTALFSGLYNVYFRTCHHIIFPSLKITKLSWFFVIKFLNLFVRVAGSIHFCRCQLTTVVIVPTVYVVTVVCECPWYQFRGISFRYLKMSIGHTRRGMLCLCVTSSHSKPWAIFERQCNNHN